MAVEDCSALAGLTGDDCVNLADLSFLLGPYGQNNGALWVTYTWDAENRLIGVEPQAHN